MTAMLQPSSAFDNSMFTAAFYSRGTRSKSHSPVDYQFTAANPYGGSSVWSAPTRDELEIAPIKPLAKQQPNDRKPEKLSLTLPPPIGRPRSQWRPTGEVDYSNSQRDEPLSAQSKSHRTDSATLTPSSRSMSDSEYSIAQSESNTILPHIQLTHFKALNNVQLPCRWDQIGEFQPRSQISRAAVSNIPMSHPQRNPPMLTKSQPFDPVPFGQAQTQHYNAFAATQYKFNSRSTFPFDLSDDTKSSQYQMGNGRGFHLLTTPKTSTLSALNQEVGQQHKFQSNLQSGYTNFDYSKFHDMHPTPKPNIGPYTREALPPSQDAHFMAQPQLKRNSDASGTAPSVTLNGRNYFDDTQFQNGIVYDVPSARGTNYGIQSLNYRPFYNNQSRGLYQTQSFNFDRYPVSSGPQDSYRNNHRRLDTTTPLPYVSTDQCPENPDESTHIVRSQLLEDFRTNHKTRKFEFRDIYDHIVEFSGDQLGSRFIQHKLENANSDEKDQVFSEIANDARQLMTDVFGNYVIQKLFEHGSQSQKKALANQMRGHMLALSMQTYGCRVVQKAFEHILTSQQAELVQELDGHILKVVENQNGNHVIQKAIECIPGKYVKFIVQTHRGHVHYLSKHAYGCRVIQRMLEHCDPEAKRVILDELHHDISDLIQDPFGNYVVQHVIVKGELCDRKSVIDKVQVKLVENAMHKFASNVVEKALDYADEEQRGCMLRKLTGRDEDGQSLPTKLLNHQFGNYVIQKAVMHLQGPALHDVVEEMQRYLAQLRRVSTGKQVAALEENIRNAQTRLDSHRQHTSMLGAPTQPSRYNTGRR